MSNPWAEGHAIQNFSWSARLERSGLWFDLHLQSADYNAEDSNAEDSATEEDFDTSQSDWQSKIVWNNYHRCTLSSTRWDGTGFQVGSKAQPLNFDALSEQEFVVDPLPVDFDQTRPFNIYLLGHDTAADHRIRFSQQSTPTHFSVDRRSRIASSYAGSDQFHYEFEAHVDSTKFEGIQLPNGTRVQDAKTLLAPFVTNLDAFTLVTQGEASSFQLK